VAIATVGSGRDDLHFVGIGEFMPSMLLILAPGEREMLAELTTVIPAIDPVFSRIEVFKWLYLFADIASAMR
jgi:hypothetical protein